jgi:hypothetical protein
MAKLRNHWYPQWSRCQADSYVNCFNIECKLHLYEKCIREWFPGQGFNGFLWCHFGGLWPMCLNDQCLKHMNDKIRVGFVPNYLFQAMELVNQLSVYEANMRIFSRALNELATPTDLEGDKDSQSNGSE